MFVRREPVALEVVRVASVNASAPRSSLVPAGRSATVSYGAFNGLTDYPAYGGRPLKSSLYRHGVRTSAAGGGLVRHASFGARPRSDNLDSDQEVLTGGTPVAFSSYLTYGQSGQTYAASSAGSHRSSGASVQLCRCGSGGPLLPSASNSPPGLPPPLPPPHSSQLPTSAYSRLVQSLPSTPNASRRPVSPMRPSFCHQLPQQHLDTGLANQSVSGPMTGLHMQHQHLAQPTQSQLYGPTSTECVTLGASTSSGTPGAPLIPNDSPASFRSDPRRPASGNDPALGRPAPKGLRALHQWTRGHRQRNNSRSRGLVTRAPLTHPGGVQPLMKLSTLVIVLLAFLIIGFIVLSPLFHYLM